MTHWRPTASLSALRARADLYQFIRGFFRARDVLEVSTPVLGARGVTDIHVPCIEVPRYGYLQPSPEYHMKRLLAAGSGPIYQIATVFRDGEAGRRHNPEFTLLEWYRPGFSLEDLMDECVALLAPLLESEGCRRVAFRELFREVTGLDPIAADVQSLRQRVARYGDSSDLERSELVDWLMAVEVEPSLPAWQLTLVHGYPGWACALAQAHTDEDGTLLARRFEIYGGGFELANGYLELLDPAEQATRFAADQEQRRAAGLPEMAADQALLDALAAGLPPCAGVAVGLERVLMARLGASHIHEVLSFPVDRA